MSLSYLKFECVIKYVYSALVLFFVFTFPAWNRAIAMPSADDPLLLRFSNPAHIGAIRTTQSYMPKTQPSSTDTHLVKTITQHWNDSTWVDQTKRVYSYNSENLCEQIVSFVAGNHWLENSREIYSYDSQARLVEKTLQKNDPTTDFINYQKYYYSHTSANNIVEIIMQQWKDGKWQNYRKNSFNYDTEGVLKESFESGWSNNSGVYKWHVVYQTTYDYDEQGNLSSFISVRPDAVLMHYHKKGCYFYNKDNKLTEYIEYSAPRSLPQEWRLVFSESYSYNELNQLAIFKIHYNGYLMADSIVTRYFYDHAGKIIKNNCETWQSDQLIELAHTLFYYDDYKKDELKYRNNQTDYLILTPTKFLEAITEYVTWRHENGLNVQVVDLEQVYTEFNDTFSRKASIREFISYTQKYWAGKPKYVLLVGDTDLIPAYMVASAVEDEGPIPIDEWYTINQFEEDNFPDLAIGRWPVKNETELESIIQKTIAFESGQGVEQSFKKLLFLNDEEINSSTGTIFEDLSSSFISTIVPPYLSADRIDIRGDSPFHDSRQSFLNEINNGIGHLIYYGHGTPTSWSRKNYLTIDDLSSLDSNGHPFILATLGCSQNFALPEGQSLVEELLLFPNGGAVATIASSGFSSYITGDRLISEIYSHLFRETDKSLGEIILEAKQGFYTKDTKPDDMTRRYTLLGDPCLTIPLWLITEITNEKQKYPTDFIVQQNYPNPFNPSTTVEFGIPISGEVDVTVYDVLGKAVYSMQNRHFNSGSHTLTIDGQNWPSGVYYYRLQCGGQRVVKKCLLMK